MKHRHLGRSGLLVSEIAYGNWITHGNQIGRAFEVDNFDTVDKTPNPQTITIPFRVRPS